jgi:dTMP kinase
MKHALLSNSTHTRIFTDTTDSGLLIAFEGLDGSGKTTQRKLFKSWLEGIHEDVVVTKWNSSPVFKPLIKARKEARSLNPINYAIIHAEDFWHRYTTVVQPALSEGNVVLADRYIFTGLARDAARGMTREWCAKLYAGVRKPDIVFYFKADINTCAMRIAASRDIKFYEAGQDVTGLDDAYESYLRFGQRVTREYDRLHNQFGFVIVDAEKPIYEQHRFIRETYLRNWTQTAPQPAFEPRLDALLSEVDV